MNNQLKKFSCRENILVIAHPHCPSICMSHAAISKWRDLELWLLENINITLSMLQVKTYQSPVQQRAVDIEKAIGWYHNGFTYINSLKKGYYKKKGERKLKKRYLPSDAWCLFSLEERQKNVK